MSQLKKVLAVGISALALSPVLAVTPAHADTSVPGGVYVCYTNNKVTNTNPYTGTTTTYYPYPDGVQTTRCSSQQGGVGLPL